MSLDSRRGMVRVRIRDWGAGIADEELDRVFDPFNRLRSEEMMRSGLGTGLGLALCRQVVERHDGAIRARAGDGAGLEVEIEIPAR